MATRTIYFGLKDGESGTYKIYTGTTQYTSNVGDLTAQGSNLSTTYQGLTLDESHYVYVVNMSSTALVAIWHPNSSQQTNGGQLVTHFVTNLNYRLDPSNDGLLSVDAGNTSGGGSSTSTDPSYSFTFKTDAADSEKATIRAVYVEGSYNSHVREYHVQDSETLSISLPFQSSSGGTDYVFHMAKVYNEDDDPGAYSFKTDASDYAHLLTGSISSGTYMLDQTKSTTQGVITIRLTSGSISNDGADADDKNYTPAKQYNGGPKTIQLPSSAGSRAFVLSGSSNYVHPGSYALAAEDTTTVDISSASDWRDVFTSFYNSINGLSAYSVAKTDPTDINGTGSLVITLPAGIETPDSMTSSTAADRPVLPMSSGTEAFKASNYSAPAIYKTVKASGEITTAVKHSYSFVVQSSSEEEEEEEVARTKVHGGQIAMASNSGLTADSNHQQLMLELNSSLAAHSTIQTTDVLAIQVASSGSSASDRVGKASVLDVSKAMTHCGTAAGNLTVPHLTGAGGASFAAPVTIASTLNVDGTITGNTSLTLDSTTITTAEIGVLDSVTAGTAAASKALVLDGSKNIATIGTIGCGAITSTGASSLGELSVGNITASAGASFGAAVTMASTLNVDGTITGNTSLTLDSTTITTAEIGVLDGVTAGTAAASKALVLDGSKNIATIGTVGCGAITSTGASSLGELSVGNITASAGASFGAAVTMASTLNVDGTITGNTSLTLDSTTITTAEIGVLDGVTAGAAASGKALVVDSNKDIGTIRNLTIDGVFTDGNYTFDTDGNVTGLGTVGCGAITSTGNLAVAGTITGDTSLTLDSTTITTAEIGVLDGVTAGTAAASKALVLGASGEVGTVSHFTASNAKITNLDVVTLNSVTQTETTLEISDKLIVASLSGSASDSDGGGLRIGGGAGSNGHASVLWSNGDSALDLNVGGSTIAAITSAGINVAGTITGDTSLTLDSTTITTAEIGVLDGVTAGTATASKAVVLGASKEIATIGTIGCGAITSTGASSFGSISSVGNVSGSGDISLGAGSSLKMGTVALDVSDLGKLDGITNGTAAAGKALVVDSNKDIGTIRNLTINGVFTDGNYTFDTNGNVTGLGTVGCGAITSTGNLAVAGTITGDTSLTLDSTTITTAEIGVLDGVTAGTAAASKALVLDASKNIATIGTIGCGAITSTGASSLGELSVGNITASAGASFGAAVTMASTLNVDGTITGNTSLTLDSTTITTAEIGVLDSVTAGTAAASKALVLDASKNIATIGTVGCGAITSTGASSLGELSVGNITASAGASFGAAVTMASTLNVDGTITGNTSLTLDSTTITTAEIGVLDGVTAGTAAASKALVLDGSKNIATIGTVGCGAITSTGISSFAGLGGAAIGAGLTATSGVISIDWVSHTFAVSATADATALVSGSTEAFIAETPLADSVQVFLNGALQRKSGSAGYYDYKLHDDNRRIKFEDALESNDVLVINYIANS